MGWVSCRLTLIISILQLLDGFVSEFKFLQDQNALILISTHRFESLFQSRCPRFIDAANIDSSNFMEFPSFQSVD